MNINSTWLSDITTQSDHIVLKYNYQRENDDWQPMEYQTMLERTPCNYGRQRTRFICCPGTEYGPCVAILYGGRIFACRQCHKLGYASQRENAYDRALHRADKIRIRGQTLRYLHKI